MVHDPVAAGREFMTHLCMKMREGRDGVREGRKVNKGKLVARASLQLSTGVPSLPCKQENSPISDTARLWFYRFEQPAGNSL